VWDRRDVLRAYNFAKKRFVTTPSAIGTVKPGQTGGPTVSGVGSALAWWTTGRGVGDGLTSDDGRVPRMEPW